MGKPTYEALSKVCSCVSSLTTFQPGDTSMKMSPERIWLKLFRKRRISVSPADKANRWEVYTSFTPAIWIRKACARVSTSLKFSCLSSISFWFKNSCEPNSVSTYCPWPYTAIRYMFNNAEARVTLNVPVGIRYFEKSVISSSVYPVEVTTNKKRPTPTFFSNIVINSANSRSRRTYVSCNSTGTSATGLWSNVPA